MRSTKRCPHREGRFGSAAPPACFKAASLISSRGISPRTPRFGSHSRRPIDRVDVVDEGIDIAIRVRLPPLDDSDLAMRSFGPSDMILVGSPALVAEYGEPKVLTDIARIPTLSTGILLLQVSKH